MNHNAVRFEPCKYKCRKTLTANFELSIISEIAISKHFSANKINIKVLFQLSNKCNMKLKLFYALSFIVSEISSYISSKTTLIKKFSRDENCCSHNFSIHSQFSILTTFKNHTQKVKQNCFNILNFCVLPWQISCNQYFWNLKYFKLFIPPWGQLLHFKRVIISFFLHESIL